MAPRRYVQQQGTEMHDLGNEAETQAQAREADIESLEPFHRGLSWTRSWKIRGNRTGTSLSTAESIRSTISHWSISWVARWSPSKRSTVTPPPPESLSEAHSKFLVAILGRPPQGVLKDASNLYINFLEFKIREAWATLFTPVLRDKVTTPPSDEDLSLAFQVLQTIVGELGNENLALSNIVDELYNDDKLLRETDNDRSKANQLVLASLGWITSLFPARHNPDPKKLQIMSPDDFSSSSSSGVEKEKPYTSRLVRRYGLKKTFTNFSQTLENNDQPLHSLLNRFGNIMPRRQRPWVSGNLTPLSIAPTRQHDDEWIKVSLLCFRTLNRVARVKIEWVDSLSLHLEFDSHNEVLKLYRLPSLCLLMCCGEKASPLSQLFSDAAESHIYVSPSSSSSEPEDASDFHREVLLSYRLLFGQDPSSSSSFQNLIRAEPLPLDYQDPLLPKLCGTSWDSTEARPVYELIVAEDPCPQYAASTHFPFLGQRLLDIQKHVELHRPNSIRSMWEDNRDPALWWAFWAVVFLGVVSLVLALIFGSLQTVLAGYQVYYARQQFLQQQNPPS